MTHMLGWTRVATVAAQPAGQFVYAGNPFAEVVSGIGAPVTSVVRSVLNGLNAAVLLVEPPSAACHSSRFAIFAWVAGAERPPRTHSSQPGGRGVTPPDCAPAVAPPDQASAPAPRPTVASARTNPTLRKMRVMRGRSGSGAPPMECSGPRSARTGAYGPHKVGTFCAVAPTRVSAEGASRVISVVRNMRVGGPGRPLSASSAAISARYPLLRRAGCRESLRIRVHSSPERTAGCQNRTRPCRAGVPDPAEVSRVRPRLAGPAKACLSWQMQRPARRSGIPPRRGCGATCACGPRSRRRRRTRPTG